MEVLNFDNQGFLKILLIVVGISSIIYITFRVIKNIQDYFVVLFLLKPYVDMTKFITFTLIGSLKLTLLDITGFLTFIIALIVYFQTPISRIYNRIIIVIFISLNLTQVIISVALGTHRILEIIDFSLRLITPYLIYLIFHQYIFTPQQRLVLAKRLWLANLGAAVFNLLIIIMGFGMRFYSREGYRYAGLYGDSYTYFSVVLLSLILGAYFLDKTKTLGYIEKWYQWIYFFNIILAGYAFNFTLQKTMALALFIFILLWWGIYKKKMIFVLPVLILSAFYYYINNVYFQLRIGPEVTLVSRLISGEQLIQDDFRGFGTGRGSRWIDYISHYFNDYTLSQQLFGSFEFFNYHSLYIAVLIQVGAVGLTVFLIMIFRFYKKLLSLYYKTKLSDYFLAIVLITNILIYGISQPSFFMTTILWYTMAWISIVNVKRIH